MSGLDQAFKYFDPEFLRRAAWHKDGARARRTVQASRVVLVLCGLALATGGATAETPPPSVEGVAAAWLAELREVSLAVRKQYFDRDLRGVDWDEARRIARRQVRQAASHEEAVGHINAMLAKLGTSHTRYFTDDDPAYYFLLDLFRGYDPFQSLIEERFEEGRPGYCGVGLFTESIGGATHVRAVVDGGPADEAGVLVGDRLVSVEGEAWHPIRPFRGRAGKRTTLLVQRGPEADSRQELEVIPERMEPVSFYLEGLRSSARVIQRAGRSVAYLRVWSYAGEQNHQAVRRLLQTPPLAGADALVMDLRDGWGGASLDYLNLFNRRIPVVESTSRDGHVTRVPFYWRKPVALLVNEWTRSGKELFAFGFRKYGYGPVVGTRTSGAVLGARAFPIGGRGLLYLAVVDIHVDGERLEGHGVEPDVQVPFAIPWAAGADPQLEAAVGTLTDLPSAVP